MEQAVLISGYDVPYSISESGAVRNLSTGKILAQGIDNGGYPRVYLLKDRRYRGRLVHRLLMEAFTDGPPFVGAMVRHLNDVPHDNRLENLSWGTHAENREDSIRNGHGIGGRVFVDGKCSRGHDVTDDRNVMVRRNGSRECIKCRDATYFKDRRRRRLASSKP